MTDASLQPSSIFLATPCSGGLATAHYVDSVLALQSACRDAGVGLKVALAGGDALIPRVRSLLTARFLDTPEHTHLLFIDADIGFKPEQVFRLLAAGKDVVGGVYPTKRVDWTRARDAAASGAKDLEAASLNYVVQFRPDASGGTRLDSGFGQVSAVGTGFLLISRNALTQVAAANPQLKARIGDVGLPARETVMVFETMIDPDTGHYLSEDYAFCRRWRDCGGEVWADFTSRLTHVGATSFTGSLKDAAAR